MCIVVGNAMPRPRYICGWERDAEAAEDSVIFVVGNAMPRPRDRCWGRMNLFLVHVV